MINNGGHHASADSGGEEIPAPSPHDQDLLLAAWREVLAEVLHTRDSEWKQQLRAIEAESMAAAAQMRANSTEICGRMEKMIAERLAQIGQPADGEPGPRGEPGPPGKIERVHEYVENTVHYSGDVITHRGSTYQAQRDTARGPPHDDLACLASGGRDGRDGVDGRSLRVRGTYRAGEEYAALDVVALGGCSFAARKDDPGECPGEGWQALTLPGKRGAAGERGPQGEHGAPGERGQGIVAWDIDSDNYAVYGVLSDHTRSEPLDLRGLFEKYLLERLSVDV